MAPAARLSGLQRDVLSLYRRLLREALRKDRNSPSNTQQRISACGLLAPGSDSSASHARERFRREALSIKRSDFKRIEYGIRKGEKMVKLLQMPGVDVVGGA